MNKYYEMFSQNQPVDLSSIDVNTLSFQDRYWVLACKANDYVTAENRFLATVCITRVKELAFLNACARQIDQYVTIDDKYIDYAVAFEYPASNQKLIDIDKWCNGVMKRQQKLNIISMIVFIFAIGLMFLLHFAFGVDFIIALAIAAIISIAGNSVVIPLIYKKGGKNKQPEVLKGDVPEDIKDLINYDEKANEILKNNDYLPILKARNEQEMNEAIRNYPKK